MLSKTFVMNESIRRVFLSSVSTDFVNVDINRDPSLK